MLSSTLIRITLWNLRNFLARFLILRLLWHPFFDSLSLSSDLVHLKGYSQKLFNFFHLLDLCLNLLLINANASSFHLLYSKWHLVILSPRAVGFSDDHFLHSMHSLNKTLHIITNLPSSTTRPLLKHVSFQIVSRTWLMFSCNHVNKII